MFLSELYRYPVKSCQAQSLRASPVGLLGLQGDRRWMVVEAENGRFLTQRAWPRLGQIAAHDDGCGQLLLQAPGRASLRVAVPPADEGLRGVTIWRDTLRVPDAGDGAAAWLSEWLGKAVRLVHCPEQRAVICPTVMASTRSRGFSGWFPLLLIGQGSLHELDRRGTAHGDAAFSTEPGGAGRRASPRMAGSGSALAPSNSGAQTECEVHLYHYRPATGERSEDREPMATLRTFREKDGDILFGQNLAVDGSGWLEVGMGVEILE